MIRMNEFTQTEPGAEHPAPPAGQQAQGQPDGVPGERNDLVTDDEGDAPLDGYEPV